MPRAFWWVDGPKLRALREARGISVTRLARRAMISVETLHRMELATPGVQSWPTNLVAVATVLGVTAEELLDGDRSAFRTDLERAWPKPSR